MPETGDEMKQKRIILPENIPTEAEAKLYWGEHGRIVKCLCGNNYASTQEYGFGQCPMCEPKFKKKRGRKKK